MPRKKDKVRVARSACCLASKQVHFRGLGASRARRFRLRQANGRRRRACRFHRWPCHSQQHKKLCHPAMPTMKRGRRHRDGRRRRSHTGISRWCCPVDRLPEWHDGKRFDGTHFPMLSICSLWFVFLKLTQVKFDQVHWKKNLHSQCQMYII
jgi:hypothetical protein